MAMSRTKKGVANRPAPVRITKRITNTKRHTTGYIIQGQFHSVSQTKNLASKGAISGVRVVGNHIQAVNGRKRLSDLPTEVRKNG